MLEVELVCLALEEDQSLGDGLATMVERLVGGSGGDFLAGEGWVGEGYVLISWMIGGGLCVRKLGSGVGGVFLLEEVAPSR